MNIMKNKIYFVLLVMMLSLALAACGNNENSLTEAEKAGGNWSSMYGGNYAKILCEDFGIVQHTAIDIGVALEDYSCDVNEIYEVTKVSENEYYISYKDNAGIVWEKQHVIHSEEDYGYWTVVERTDSISMNKNFLESELGLIESRAESDAIKLDNAGCGFIMKCVDRVDGEHAYQVTLINKDGQRYIVSFSKDGFIGTIKNQDGDVILAPID